jgi:hypothetical protein
MIHPGRWVSTDGLLVSSQNLHEKHQSLRLCSVRRHPVQFASCKLSYKMVLYFRWIHFAIQYLCRRSPHTPSKLYSSWEPSHVILRATIALTWIRLSADRRLNLAEQITWKKPGWQSSLSLKHHRINATTFYVWSSYPLHPNLQYAQVL